MHRGVRRNTLRASPPTFGGAISIEVIPVLIEPKRERGHPGEVAPVEDALVVDEEADSGDRFGDLHRLQELPHLLVADDRPSPGCDLRLEPEQVS